jgi:peptidoglycan/LPS O-acetylase OafA/YrhL
VICYLGVFVLGVTGLLRSRRLAVVLVAAAVLALVILELLMPVVPKGVETTLRLPLIFACGGALYLWRGMLRLSGAAALTALIATALLAGTPLYKPALFVASSYAVLWFALSPVVARWTFEPNTDLSYGTYLYGWPVQQTLHALFPTLSPLALTGPSVAATLAVAALSWHLVEKPALSVKARALGRATLKTIEPAVP